MTALTLEEIREHLGSLDHPANGRRRLLEQAGVDPGEAADGRVEVFDVACRAAEHVLAYLGVDASDEGKALAATNVLLRVAEEVLQLLIERADLPLRHIVPELQRTRRLVIDVGRIDTAREGPA